MTAHRHDHPHTHDHSRPAIDRAALMARAEALCTEARESLTPLRRRVLELLIDARGPAKAYDLLEGLKSAEGAPAKPPSVYRALEFLTRLGLAHRVESLNAFVACDVGACARTTIFLICDCCGRTEEFDAGHAATDVAAAAGGSGFRVERTVIEGRGLCAGCAG